jgi:hypothetical protein
MIKDAQGMDQAGREACSCRNNIIGGRVENKQGLEFFVNACPKVRAVKGIHQLGIGDRKKSHFLDQTVLALHEADDCRIVFCVPDLVVHDKEVACCEKNEEQERKEEFQICGEEQRITPGSERVSFHDVRGIVGQAGIPR